jgi:ABC-type multidrug transport system ATPase subunit
VSERALLVATAISKSYGRQRVLEDVSLELGAGLLVAITGPNGAGKSTLLGCLAGTIHSPGRVLLDGVPIGARTRGRVAYLAQRIRLPASATVGDVLELFRGLARTDSDRVALPADFLPDANRKVGQLSGGQAQRVALAAVLAGRPDLILLDEPLANLDDSGRDATTQLLAAHAAAGALVLIANPTVTDFLPLLDQVIHVESGKVRFSGATADYLGRLEMSIWVRSNGVVTFGLDDLPGVLGTRARGEWTEVLCHEDDAVGLLQELAARKVPPDHIRVSDRAGRVRASSPGGSSR